MAIARDLLNVYGQLRARGDVRGLFSEDAIPLLDGARERRLAEQMGGAANLIAALQAMALREEEHERTRVEAQLVATIPRAITSDVRRTSDVIAEMLRGAREPVAAIGYEISDVDVIAALHDAARRGVLVQLVCDRARGAARSLLRTWPADAPGPVIFHDGERADATVHSSMHGKALLVGDADVLVTSANFTFHGLNGNFEIGVRVRGPGAGDVRALLRQLIAAGLLERVS